MKKIAIASYKIQFEAEIAKGALEAEGIESIITINEIGGMSPILPNNISLSVNQKDVDKAKKILNQ